MAAAEIDQRHRCGHGGSQHGEPDRGAGSQQNPVEIVGVRRCAEPRAGRGPNVVCHQQLVCAELPVLEDSTVPSLVVIEQLSLLTKNRLDACTEPTSDCEIGVTVSDHGM